ncbi:response regulator transcription factor [Pseudoalteromonas sp. SSM20]|uniref:response regulator transcription factor n=1 Tax=Pseudoalteromonas sp. SSM20 TaxID=3139394 RepID=UPI003BAD8FCC
MEKFNLIIVEDDHELASLTQDFFQQFEFNCKVISEGQQAVTQIIAEQPDLVLLDLMLPDIDGMQVFQQIKPAFTGKVAMLTARGDTIDQVLGLEFGADDYISKPIEPRLLLAKCRALLRREVNVEVSKENSLSICDITINKHKREVQKAGQPLEFAAPEYDLLLLLIAHRGEVISRDFIFKSLWGMDYDGQNRQVDIYISSIRSKLESDPNQPSLIKTVRSKGYLFTG